jgi:hypothetical protein
MVLPDKVIIYKQARQHGNYEVVWQGKGKLYMLARYDEDVAPQQGGMRLIVPKEANMIEQMMIAEVNGQWFTIKAVTPMSDARGIHHYTLIVDRRRKPRNGT